MDKEIERTTALSKRIKHTLIYSNIWVALSLGSLTYISLLLNKSNHSIFILLNTCIGFTGYNYIYWSVYYRYPNKLFKPRKAWMSSHKKLMLFLSTIALIVVIFIFLRLDGLTQQCLIIFGFSCFLYIIPLKKSRGLRWIPGLKIFIISAAWVALTLFIPLINHHSNTKLTTGLFIMLFTIGITIPFDIRDSATDPDQLKTLPQLIGNKYSIYLSLISIVIANIGVVMTYPIGILMPTLVLAVLSAKIILKLKHNKSYDYINFWIEGIPIFWFILIYISTVV